MTDKGQKVETTARSQFGGVWGWIREPVILFFGQESRSLDVAQAFLSSAR